MNDYERTIIRRLITAINEFWKAKDAFDDHTSDDCGCPCPSCLDAMFGPLIDVNDLTGHKDE